MSQKNNKELKRIADNLPRVYIKKPCRKIVFEGDVKKIIYTEQTELVDHYDRLKIVHNLQGFGGVRKYIVHAQETGKKQAPYYDRWERQLAKTKAEVQATKKPSILQRFISWIKNVYTTSKIYLNVRKAA